MANGHLSTMREFKPNLKQSDDINIFFSSYMWFNTSENMIIQDPSITEMNTYTGGVYRKYPSSVPHVQFLIHEQNKRHRS